MRALVMHRHGGPEVLTLERDWPDPLAGPGEIVVSVHACALNFLDIFTREGMPGEPTPLPHITGGDIAGVVHAVGEGVTSCVVGARVVLNPAWGCGMCEYCRDGLMPRCLRGQMLGETEPGGLAEYTKCPAGQAIVVPPSFGLAEMKQINLHPDQFHGEWKYVIRPHRRHTDA